MKTYIFALLNFVFLASSYGNKLTGSYELLHNVLLFDVNSEPVGYQVKSILDIKFKGPNVYKFQVLEPKLHVMSRKAPTPRGFIQHDSNLEKAVNNYFLIEWENGLIKGLYLDEEETVSLKNLKKSIASLFQFTTETSEKSEESDSSGLCSVSYQNDGKGTIHKSKSSCSPTLNNDIWGGVLSSDKNTVINVSGEKILSINSSETYSLKANLAEFAVLHLTSTMSVTRIEDISSFESLYSSEVLTQSLTEMSGRFTKHSLSFEIPAKSCTPNICPKLSDVVLEVKKSLGKLGSAKSANVIYKLSRAFKYSDKDVIYNTLKKKEFSKILPLLIDVAGSGQNEEIHQAVLRILKINTDKIDKDLCERYLWALSVSPTPSVNITKDVIQLIKQKHKDEKLYQTILLTGTALVKKISMLHNDPNHNLVQEIFEELESSLKKCEKQNDACQLQYLKALSNLENNICLKVFLDYSVNSSRKSSVAAMRGVYKLGKNSWNNEVLKISERILFSGKEFDSSARIVALQILLESDPSEQLLSKIFSLLPQPDRELNQFILEKINLLSSRCSNTKHKIQKSLKTYKNWGCLAQGGLSTSFTRDFMERGFLSTDQEIQGGILKSGGVHVNLIHNDTTTTLFTLGLFSSGMGSFVSNSQEENGDNDDETSAGMSLEILGVQLRPFVFFNGQGELMGHVWSGTASSKTSAFEATYLVGLNEVIIPLGNAGVFLNVNLSAAVSAELSGLIEISLWNRNAHSAVYNRAGISLQGMISMESEFVRSKSEFELFAEPSLDLTSEIDFGSKVALCLLLQQPSSVVKFNTFKVERIEGSKHKQRKARYTSIPVPGRTYALNQKNNEMCNMIHRS